MKPTLVTRKGACSLPYDPTPSQEDIQVTRRLKECGKMIGIELLDHLVIGDRRFISLKEKGYL
ncbi:DNA repair protein RadC [Halobacillus karajensis]|uniref:DNA repair protein RadC n=1 Tax=Halobacillus karajensis TaxID=195088 RepID=A0A024P6X6_9BACI|nr:DNA repair protein RadC [Halobacillus karajensis]CDQ24528.1 DNA repair protein RadC [Halobacillus karajensis]CDQ29224.1 DNA repair protein RadC [Halobacillus karajensis]SEH57814.1 DNA repair protein RadC [Halobacillus karajensis]